jgi:hypothetical protein
MNSTHHVNLANYGSDKTGVRVYDLTAAAHFTPIDINVDYLAKAGWSPSTDHFRFLIDPAAVPLPGDLPSVAGGGDFLNLLIRRYDQEQDCLAVIHVFPNGLITILSNDSAFAKQCLQGLFVNVPPSFHSTACLTIKAAWVTDSYAVSYFSGMVNCALNPHLANQSCGGIDEVEPDKPPESDRRSQRSP